MRTVFFILMYTTLSYSLFAQFDLMAHSAEEWSLRFLENPPEFKGGEEALAKYVHTHAIYTEKAIEEKVRGRVYLRFMIDTVGVAHTPEIQKGLHPDLDTIAINMVKNMPIWTPAVEKGKPIECPYTLVINFDFKGRGSPDKPEPSSYWKETGKHKFIKKSQTIFGKDSIEIERYFKYVTWNYNGLRIEQIDLDLLFAKKL